MKSSPKGLAAGTAMVTLVVLAISCGLWAEEPGASQSGPSQQQGILATTILAPASCTGQDDYLTRGEAAATPGLIPVMPVDQAVTELRMDVRPSASRPALGFVVPAHGSLRVTIDHQSKAYFTLTMVDRFGRLAAGMLRNLQLPANPEAVYTNPSDEAQAVYVVVSYPEWVYTNQGECTVRVSRD